MKRTTIMADDDVILQMQHLAARRGETFTEVVQEAMRAYLTAQQHSPHLSFIGVGASAEPVDYADGRDEEALAAGAHPIYGLTSDAHCAQDD